MAQEKAFDPNKKLDSKPLHALEAQALQGLLESTYATFCVLRRDWIQQGSLSQKQKLRTVRKNIARLKTLIGLKLAKGKSL